MEAKGGQQWAQWAAEGQSRAEVPLLWGLCWEPWGGRVLMAPLGRRGRR